MDWHVVSVTSRMELETVRRINSGGFVAHCPVYQKKYARRDRGRYLARIKIEPLFPGYIFVQRDDVFRKDAFETTKIKLMVFRKALLTDAQMSVINSTALGLTMAAQQITSAASIRRGDLLQLLHGAMQGEPVEALQVRKDQILIRWKERVGWRDAWINRTALGKAI